MASAVMDRLLHDRQVLELDSNSSAPADDLLVRPSELGERAAVPGGSAARRSAIDAGTPVPEVTRDAAFGCHSRWNIGAL